MRLRNLRATRRPRRPGPPDVRRRAGGLIGLAAGLFALATVWLLLLPTVSSLETVESALAQRRQRGIDAAALYYTDLPLFDEVLQRNREFHRRHGQSLWRPGPPPGR